MCFFNANYEKCLNYLSIIANFPVCSTPFKSQVATCVDFHNFIPVATFTVISGILHPYGRYPFADSQAPVAGGIPWLHDDPWITIYIYVGTLLTLRL